VVASLALRSRKAKAGANDEGHSSLTLMRAMRTFLRYDLQPPVSGFYVIPAMRALRFCERGETDRRVLLPTLRRIPAGVLVERWHLDRL
jgi:hypothetical protein